VIIREALSHESQDQETCARPSARRIPKAPGEVSDQSAAASTVNTDNGGLIEVAGNRDDDTIEVTWDTN
jgi:hypothetical protein